MRWKILLAIGIIVFVVTIILTIMALLIIKVPADVQYGNLFGSDVIMATQGSTTLTGPNSIQDYVNRIWTTMNNTFNTKHFLQIHNNPWPWGQTSDNTLAKENEYLNSLNVSLVLRQKWVDAVLNGTTAFTGVDPVQTAINQTRQEMNAYGGLDWAINGAWYLQDAPTAYWLWVYLIIGWIFAVIVEIVLVIRARHSQEIG